MPRRDAPHAPCCACGDPEGTRNVYDTVIRVSLARFGVEGQGCHRCYSRLHTRAVAVASLRAVEVRPCARCGEPEGWYRYGLHGKREPYPVRMTFDPAEGPICGECARREYEVSGFPTP